MSAHDRWLANYRSYETEVYCTNRACVRFGQPQTVRYEEEYGQGWTTPEECEDCKGGEFSFDPPPEEEDDDEDEG